MKRRAVHERNGDKTVIAGFKNIAFMDGKTNAGITHDLVRAGNRDRPNGDLQFTDDGWARRLSAGSNRTAVLYRGIPARQHTAAPVSGAGTAGSIGGGAMSG